MDGCSSGDKANRTPAGSDLVCTNGHSWLLDPSMGGDFTYIVRTSWCYLRWIPGRKILDLSSGVFVGLDIDRRALHGRESVVLTATTPFE